MAELDIKYEWQRPFYDSERYVCVDFYIPRLNIVFEIDGLIHESQKQKDLERTLYLKRKHNISNVIRFKNKDIVNNKKYVLSRLRDIKDNYINN